MEDLGYVGDHGGHFGHRGAFVNKYVVFVVIHDDGLGVGGCGYQLVFANKERHFLQSCHQKFIVVFLGDIILGQKLIEDPLCPQEAHMTDLVHSGDQSVKD